MTKSQEIVVTSIIEMLESTLDGSVDGKTADEVVAYCCEFLKRLNHQV